MSPWLQKRGKLGDDKEGKRKGSPLSALQHWELLRGGEVDRRP